MSDVACEALMVLLKLGARAEAAFVHQGAASVLVSAASSGERGFGWRRRCATVVFRLAESSDAMVIRALLSCGLVPMLLSMCSCADADASTCLLAAHTIGALSWRGSSSQIRSQLRAQLVSAHASREFILACNAYPACTALRLAIVLLLGEMTMPEQREEKMLSPEEEERLRVGELAARKPTPAAPIPKPPPRKLTMAEEEEAEAEARARADAAAGLVDGLAQAGTSDGAVGISESEALDMLEEADVEAAMALEGASSESRKVIDAEACFLLAFISDSECCSDPKVDKSGTSRMREVAIAAGLTLDEPTAPTEVKTAGAPPPAERMQAPMEWGGASTACASMAFVSEDRRLTQRAVELLQAPVAQDHAHALALIVLHRMAMAGEVQRAALIKHGAIPAALKALPANARHAERQASLCGTLAHLSCTAAEQTVLHRENAVDILVPVSSCIPPQLPRFCV